MQQSKLVYYKCFRIGTELFMRSFFPETGTTFRFKVFQNYITYSKRKCFVDDNINNNN